MTHLDLGILESGGNSNAVTPTLKGYLAHSHPLLISRLRKFKGVRKIIASTHNANDPVLGDAELIVALGGDGYHGMPAPNGIGLLDKQVV